MRHAAGPRREIGIRTAFNILGPITNPAWATTLLTGVAVGPLAPKVAEVFHLLGTSHALVVHGQDGVDELSICAPSQVFEVTPEGVVSYEIEPEQFGLQTAPPGAVRGGTVPANLELAEQALTGRDGAAQDVILLNAAAGLYVAGLAPTIRDGVEQARELIASGKAWNKVSEVRELSQALRREQGSP